jgi:hypothetical protein
VATTDDRFVASERPILLPCDGKIEPVYVNLAYEPIFQNSRNRFKIIAVAIDVSPQVQARQTIEEVVEERTQDLAKAVFDLKQSDDLDISKKQSAVLDFNLVSKSFLSYQSGSAKAT